MKINEAARSENPQSPPVWSQPGTFADQQLVVVDEADGALAPEAADHVDTHSVLTHSRDLSALVDI